MKRLGYTKWQTYHLDAAGVLVCGVLAVLGYIVGIDPLVKQQEGLAAQEARLNVQRHDAVKLAGSTGSLERKLDELKRALDESPVQLQAAGSVNRRIARLASLAAECGMKIDEIQPGKWTASPRYKSVPIRLVAGGRFPACVALLRRLRKDFPDTAVASFELTGEPRNPEAPAKFEINLVWYAAARPQTTRTYERPPADFAHAGRESYNQ